MVWTVTLTLFRVLLGWIRVNHRYDEYVDKVALLLFGSPSTEKSVMKLLLLISA